MNNETHETCVSEVRMPRLWDFDSCRAAVRSNAPESCEPIEGLKPHSPTHLSAERDMTTVIPNDRPVDGVAVRQLPCARWWWWQ